MKKLPWLGLVVLVALAGCNLFTRDFSRSTDEFADPTKGSLVLLLDGSALPTQTIAPTLFPMNVSSYFLRFTKPDLTYQYQTILGSGLANTFSGFDTGNWKVRIGAYNITNPNEASPTNGLIGTIDGGIWSYDKPFTITAGVVTIVNVAIIPVIGTGTIELSVTWPTAAIGTPVLEATLGGTAITFGSTTTLGDNSTKTYINTALTTGYKALILQMKNNTTLVWGWMEAVRILDFATTQKTSIGTWSLSSSLDGGATLTSNTNMQNPIDINFTPITITDFSASAGLTVTAGPSGYTYAWYLDGLLLTDVSGVVTGTTTVTVVFPANSTKLTAGGHNLSVLFTSSGGVLSSKTIGFNVL
jgi:hypothetical protein